jgi:hypothetical protein
MPVNPIYEPKPFSRCNEPYQDAGLTFFMSTAALSASTTATIDFSTGLTNTINGTTLVTKSEFYNNLSNNAAFPLLLAARLGTFTGNTASSALPTLTLSSETPPNELLTGNPRIQASTSLDYVNMSTQVILFGFNKSPVEMTKLSATLVLPAGVSLSSLVLYFAPYKHADALVAAV